MINYSNSELVQIIRSRPGGVQSFLAELTSDELREALENHQRISDIQYRNNRTEDIYKENVLDLTLKQVIYRCKAQGLINYFNWKLAEEKSRLQNHPEFDMKLVNNMPEKYYVGEKSSHMNHAREIQQLYGIINYPSSEHQEQDNNQNVENNENGIQISLSQDQNDGFLVDDDEQIQESYQSEDEFKEKKKMKKKINKLKNEVSSLNMKIDKIKNKIMKKKIKKQQQQNVNIQDYLIQQKQNQTPKKYQISEINQQPIIQKSKKMCIDSD